MRRTRFAFNNWFSRVYLLGVLVVAGWALYAAATDPGPSFALIWPVVVTMPASFLGVIASGVTASMGAGPVVSRVLLGIGVVLGAVVNATVIGLLAQLIRRQLTGKSA